jgi:ADP-dependent NAD(P)H-hydrate dehydratase / NAD(P)H-hydrate epimerase
VAFDSLGVSAGDRWAGIAALAASIHGRAGRLASRGGPVTASDVANSIREVMTTV